MAENSVDTDGILLRFNRLIRELLQGGTRRETFQRWEVELLLDMQSCQIREWVRYGVIRRYQWAVQRRIERGDTVPMKLSEFLATQHSGRVTAASDAPKKGQSAGGDKIRGSWRIPSS